MVGTCMALQFRSGTGQLLYLFLAVPASQKNGWPLGPCPKGITCPCRWTLYWGPCHISIRKSWMFGNHSLSLWHYCQQFGLLLINDNFWTPIWNPGFFLAFPDLALQLFLKNNFLSLFDTAWCFYHNVSSLSAIFSFLNQSFYFEIIHICSCIASILLKMNVLRQPWVSL